MITLTPYCLRLVEHSQSAVSKTILPIVGDTIEKTVSILDSLCAWWRQVIRVLSSRIETFFVQSTEHRKACMASTKRPAARTKTSAALFGRRVTLSLSEREYQSLCYHAGRFRLTPQELLKGLIPYLPDEPTYKFTRILLSTTKGEGK